MNLTVTLDSPQSARLSITGELDFLSAPQLLDAVTDVMDRHDGLENLHLDFAGLTFCDSAGLSAFVVIDRRCAESRIRLHLDHRTRQLDRILDVTGLAEHFAAAAEGAQGETVG